jgi:hypothetical protein
MFDQYSDSMRTQLHKFNQLLELPEFVKTADESDPDEIRSLPSSCFADPVHRKYPVHTRQDAYLSRLYFSKNASMYKDAKQAKLVGENLEKSASFWKLDTEYQMKTAMEKTASASYDIPIQDSNGGTIDKWVLNTPRDFEKAAIQIFENKNMFSFPQRSSVAKAMLKIPLRKEATLSPEVSEYLEKAAGYGMNTKENVMDLLMSRSVLYNMKNSAFGDRIASLAEKVASEDITPNLLEKVATVIDICDRELNLTKHYNNGRVASPEEELFVYTEKVANDIKSANIKLTNGKVMSLDKLAEDKLNRYFEEYIGELPSCGYQEKIAIVQSLPSPDADALVNFMEN